MGKTKQFYEKNGKNEAVLREKCEKLSSFTRKM